MPKIADVSFLLCMLLALPSLAATELVPGVHVIRGAFVPGSQPDGNTVLFDAPGGLVVIDTGRHAGHTRSIIDYAKSVKRPVAAVVNTHWHLDHIGGNVLIRREYPQVKIYASGALLQALTGFLARYRKQLEGKKEFEAEVKLIDAGETLAPDVVITGSGVKSLAGRNLSIGLETHSVTAGDVWVLDEAAGVLVAGDLVTLPAPFLDTACPARWEAALDRLATIDFHLLVPGHGSALTRKQFAVYHRAYRALLHCQASKDRCVDDWVTTIAPLMPDHDDRFTRAMTAYYVDLLRADPARLKPLCGG